MTDPINILILCTGNSARSILGEALINHLGGGRLRGFSAGSFPKGRVHPGALAVLARNDVAVERAESKSWDVFTADGAPPLHIVITVCDNAAGETCPIWPGRPMSAHWGIEDPAAVEGSGQREAFERALHYLSNRISLFLALPHDNIDEMAMDRKLKEIGRAEGASHQAESTE